MREQFLAGDDVNVGVRPEILLSWHRCRDEYAVDPSQERAPSSPEREPCQLLDEKVVVTELAGLAKSIEPDVEAIGGLIAITDGRGGILAAWGHGATLRLADEANLAARCAWSEQGAGTNGMGTALASEGPIFIRGAEHWCSGFHEWDCAGVAIRDHVARLPLGALDVSSPVGSASHPNVRALTPRRAGTAIFVNSRTVSRRSSGEPSFNMNCAKRASPRAVAKTPALPETPPSMPALGSLTTPAMGCPCHRFVGAIRGSRRLGGRNSSCWSRLSGV